MCHTTLSRGLSMPDAFFDVCQADLCQAVGLKMWSMCHGYFGCFSFSSILDIRRGIPLLRCFSTQWSNLVPCP